jgi:XTP/dITP diphosphohydrolase
LKSGSDQVPGRLVLATRNKDKAVELRALLGKNTIEVVTLDEFPNVGEIVEDGATLEENALKKAGTVFRATGLPALADDSGLEVYYLNMEPGVFSSRYSGPGATYESNCRKLLEALRGLPPRRRAARFRCALALVADGIEEIVEGSCDGTILEESRGTNGFGYDSIFRPTGHEETFAEMEPDLKNSLSHRSQALLKMKPFLMDLSGRPG